MVLATCSYPNFFFDVITESCAGQGYHTGLAITSPQSTAVMQDSQSQVRCNQGEACKTHPCQIR